jgi:GT2 family glycosyltransferase
MNNLLASTVAIEFDEAAYLATFPDVTIAMDTGEFSTAREHFDFHGHREGRLAHETYLRALGLAPPLASGEKAEVAIDAICLAGNTVFIVGWIDDRNCPLASISIFAGEGRAWHTTAFARVRRLDVEAARAAAPGHLFGFWCVLTLAPGLAADSPWLVRARRADGRYGEVKILPQMLSETTLRATILGHFAAAKYFGNRDIESFLALDVGIGDALVALNRRITDSITAGAWVSHYGPPDKKFIGSIIVCLYGKPEFMFLQSAFFSLGPRALEYEFVYVCNSPELTETLVKEATNCARIYGVSITLVCLPENAGFGAANNIGARHARSRRLLITNPDVFPRDETWAARHAAIVATVPPDQTALFGAPLFYDDGSLMHHGMYFEIDPGLSIRPGQIYERPMIRTEHYGKGAPPGTKSFLLPRPVPAITGAFMSTDRAWFESLGGFTEDFLYGHYEDADLCLKSLTRGRPPWMQDLPLWHLEGKGSARRDSHEGGSLVNRWLFTRQWGEFIAENLRGPNPTSAALQPAAAVTLEKANATRRRR